MKTQLTRSLFIVFAFLLSSHVVLSDHSSTPESEDNGVCGLWKTILEEKGSELIFVLEIKPNVSDSLLCTIHLPDFGMSDLPYGKIVMKGDSIVLPGLEARFNKHTGEISGNFNNQGHHAQVVFKKIIEKPVFPVQCSEKKEDWLFPTKGAIWSSPTVYDDNLLFGNDHGNVYKIDIHSKSIQWVFECQGPVRSKVMVFDDNACFTSDDGFLYFINFNTGKLNWKTDIGNNAAERIVPAKDAYSYDYLCSSPIVSHGKIFVGSMDSSIYSIDMHDGAIDWTFKTEGMVRSTPAVDEEIVYVGSWDHHMYALDRENGTLIWKYNAGWSIQSSPLVVDDKLVFGSRAATVFALDIKTGEELWKTRYWGSWVESSPVYYDNKIYIGSSDFRKVHALEPSDGRVLLNTRVEGWAWPTVALTDDFIFTGSIGSLHYMENMHGRFYAFERESGEPVWQLKVPDDPDNFTFGFASSPVIWKEWVFVGGLDGQMYGVKYK